MNKHYTNTARRVHAITVALVYSNAKTGDEDGRWNAEGRMDAAHWCAPTIAQNQYLHSHLYMMAGGPLDAPDVLPRGGMRRTNKLTEVAMIPREI